jgi:serine/threonine-protein kinase RIM15
VRQVSLEKLRAKRDANEKRRSEGSVDSADDEDDELGLGRLAVPNSGNGTQSAGCQSRQHFRSKSVLPSSKLGIEMMRANSHDSVVLANTPEKSSGLANTSDSVPESQNEDYDDEGDMTVIHTPPDQCGGSSEDNATVVGADETPRPLNQQRTRLGDNDPTPRPPVKSASTRHDSTNFF